eukprot:scaffold4358_cov177-Ochromonas_danica.AAC.2
MQSNIVNMMLPLYYTTEVLTMGEYDIISECWDSILTSSAPGFQRLRKDPAFPHNTCISYFYETYYHRLFDMNPMCRDLFQDVARQGKFLVKMISLALSERRDPEKYEETLIKLAEIHNERGVKASEYGIVGDVLFYTVKRCVGEDHYTDRVHLAWVKIISRMLRTMVPIAVTHELVHGPSPLRTRALNAPVA